MITVLLLLDCIVLIVDWLLIIMFKLGIFFFRYKRTNNTFTNYTSNYSKLPEMLTKRLRENWWRRIKLVKNFKLERKDPNTTMERYTKKNGKKISRNRVFLFRYRNYLHLPVLAQELIKPKVRKFVTVVSNITWSGQTWLEKSVTEICYYLY